MNNLALQFRLSDLVEEYDRKAGALPAAVATFGQAIKDLETAATLGNAFGGAQAGRAPGVEHLRECLLTSAWRRVYDGLNIKDIAPASDRKRFEQALTKPPEFTLDNIRATFGDYVAAPRFHILRGLAEVFCALDSAYKSHSKVKIGVAGLPKRVIISNALEYGRGQNTLGDVLAALASYRGESKDDAPAQEGGKPVPFRAVVAGLLDNVREHGGAYWRGVEILGFKNGNIHLIFDADTLREINLALAEFYGDVLPDTEEAPRGGAASSALSKDLQYYPTPRAVLDLVAQRVDMAGAKTVLEPSCGDGRVLDFIRDANPRASLVGVECHAGRAGEAEAKGHKVYKANFLDVAPIPFDLIVMNPPFYGKHWRKHLDHARKFMAPGATLACILPASAFYDGHLADLNPCPWEGWRDLPAASFKASGTNIPTGVYIERKHA